MLCTLLITNIHTQRFPRFRGFSAVLEVGFFFVLVHDTCAGLIEFRARRTRNERKSHFPGHKPPSFGGGGGGGGSINENTQITGARSVRFLSLLTSPAGGGGSLYAPTAPLRTYTYIHIYKTKTII